MSKKAASVFFTIEVDMMQQILLVRDRKTKKWSLPGGAKYKGETPEKTARREFREETGLCLNMFQNYNIHSKENKIGNMPVFIYGLQMNRDIFDKVKKSLKFRASEIIEARFFDILEMDDLTLRYPKDLGEYKYFFSIIDEDLCNSGFYACCSNCS